jgi:putative inorganic carbon (HCO3(-)) transporter
MSALTLWSLELRLAAITASKAFKLLLWLAVILALGAALTVLPVTWIAVGLVALIVGILILIKPQAALYLLCFAVPFGSLFSIDLGGISVGAADALVGVALAAWLARAIAVRQLIRWPRLTWPVLVFLGAGMLSLLNAQSLPLAAKELAKWVEFLGIMLVVTNLTDERQRHVLVASLLLAGVAQAALGTYQFLTRSGPEFFAFGRFLRAYGTFEQPNPFGGYMGLVAPLALALVLYWRSRELAAWLKWLALASLAAVTAGIAMSGSRGAWLGASAAIGLVAVLRGRQSQVILSIVVLLAALAGMFGGLDLVPDQIIERVTGFLPLIGGLSTGSDIQSIEVTDANYANLERLAFWQAAADMWSDRLWLGVGIGNYQAVYADYSLPKWRRALGHAHNYYLNIAAETGLIGLLSYLCFWAIVFWQLAQTARRDRSAMTKALALGALGVIVHASVHNVVDNLWVHHLFVHVALVLGLTQTQIGAEPALRPTLSSS